MKKFVLFAVLLMITSVSVYAQHATVVYNYERNYFNENQPLPAETNFVVNGGIDGDVNIVEINIFRSGDQKQKRALYKGVWKRPFGNSGEMFSVPMNYKMRGNGEYDFRIDYYRSLTEAEREYLRIKLFQTLDAYVVSAFEVTNAEVKLLKPYKQVISDLNSIVDDALSVYQNRAGLAFEGFSDVVKNKVEQVQAADLNKGRFLFAGKKKAAKANYASRLLNELMQVVNNEVEQYLNTDLSLLSDTKIIDDYSVGKTQNSLSLNVGYGGVYFDGGFNELDYGSAPFAGVSFPFARKAFSPFFANTSVSVGVFVTNLTDANGNEVSGPIIKRPSYVGLGYKVFKFVRLNAGAAFTESSSNGSSGIEGLRNVNIRPFVGVSAEINLSVSLGDK